MTEPCTICPKQKDSEHHYPEYHVAYAYHKGIKGRCISCAQNFPCETAVKFGVDKLLRSEL